MRASADQQRFFLFAVRPAVSLAGAVALVAAALLVPGARERLLLGVAAALLALAAASALGGRWAAAAAIRAGLLADTALLAAVGVELQAPFRLAIGYLWPIGIAAVVLGALDAAVYGMLALVAVAVTPAIVGYAIEPRLLGATEVGLALLGGALAAATRPGRRAHALLAERAAQEAAALAISERIRASLDRDAILRSTAAELGRSLEASACTLLLAPAGDAEPREFNWTAAVGDRVPEATRAAARAILERGEPLAHDDHAFAALIGWGEQPLAAVALADERPRAWEREALPLLERLGPHLAAALAQADAYAQQQQTIATLREFDEQRQQLVAAVSHELRTPITAVLGFLETLLGRPDLPADDQRRFLHEATGGARRLARLVDDLLVLTRTERRSLPLLHERVEPARLLEQALGGLIVPADRELEFHTDGDCTIAGDPDRLLQVLTNLLSNAIAHGQGRITVDCRRTGGRVVVAVADDGPPIPPPQLGQLFVPFARFGANEGTGLGLAIARSLAEAHGGTLTYRSPPGGRHAFVVELPAADAVAPAVAG